MSTAHYLTRLELANNRELNLYTNPCAQVSLADASGVNVALARVTGVASSPRDTAFRLTPNAASANSHFTVGGGGGAGFRNGMRAGATFTVRGTLVIDAVLSGTADARARRIVFVHRNADGTFTDTYSAQAPNTPGVYHLSVTVAIPAGATEAHVRLFHGHPTGAAAVYWHSLRLSEGTSTEYFDGSDFHGYTWNDNEYGWDGAKGLSTSWRVQAGGTTLAEAEFELLSLDRRRVPFIEATISMPYPGQAIEDRLDPRKSVSPVVYYSIEHRQRPGLLALVSRAPAIGGNNSRGKLWVRDVTYDRAAGRLTIEAASGEVVFEDKKRISDATLDTGATTAAALWQYALVDVGEVAAEGFIDAYATGIAIPAGDRRLWLQGESASDLFEAELNGAPQPIRSYCDDRGVFEVRQIALPPGAGNLLDAPLPLSSGDAGTITESHRRRSRSDGWADATLIIASYRNSSGTQITTYARDNEGVNRAGQVVRLDRPLVGGELPANYTREAQRAGVTESVTAQCDFRYRPGRRVAVTFADGSPGFTARLDRAEYRVREGLMQLEGYTE